MKRKTTVFLAALLVLSLNVSLLAKAAYIDAAVPLNGQYMLAYNPVSAGGTRSTGVLSGNENEYAVNVDGSPADGEENSGTDAPVQVEPSFRAIEPEALEDKKPGMYINASPFESWAVGDVAQFLAQTALDSQPYTYTVNAQLLAAGLTCDIFVEEVYVGEENPLKISQEQAEAIAAEFDRVQGIMQNDFGPNLNNGDNKIVILLHNIKEYQSGGSGPVYVAGYFDPGDYIYDPAKGGNNLVMLHIDIPQLLLNSSTMTYEVNRGHSTMVHEFQHLINWTDTFYTYLEKGVYRENDLWLNEMMSMAAEHMMYNPLYSRISSYNSSSKVRSGAVLTYTNYAVNGSTELGANYGLPYLFGQYLRVQTEGLTGINGASGGDGLFKSILQSDYTDHSAIMEALNALSYSVADFDRLQVDFRIATVLNEGTGYYGFCGDIAFNAVNAPIYSGTGTTLDAGAMLIVALPEGTFTPTAGATTSFLAFSADVEGIRVADGNGDPVSELADNQILDISANISTVDSDAVPIVVAGLYTSEGRMIRLWGFTGSVGVGKTTMSLTLPGNVSGCYLKIFYMDGSVGSAPLCAMYQVG